VDADGRCGPAPSRSRWDRSRRCSWPGRPTGRTTRTPLEEGAPTDTPVEASERFYRLDGIVFRVRPDLPEQGAQYLRNGTWVWTPITSGGVIDNPQAIPLSDDEADRYRDID
jgi:hypothetical protein